MLKGLLLLKYCRISSQLIKRNIEKQLNNTNKDSLPAYPRTFQQKIILLNNPSTIQKLQIVQFGVKYKPGKKYIAFLLSLSALFFYYNSLNLPEKVIDRYFAISNFSSQQYFSGFIFAAFMYEKHFGLYLPLLLVVNQMSKFISNRWILSLIVTNMILNGAAGSYLVDRRVSKYEVWDQERVSYGQATVLSLSMMFWGALGLTEGFTALKSKLFLKSIPGLGIIRNGIPIGYVCLFYIFLQVYLWHKNKKNSQLMTISVLSGFVFGLLIRKFSPLK